MNLRPLAFGLFLLATLTWCRGVVADEAPQLLVRAEPQAMEAIVEQLDLTVPAVLQQAAGPIFLVQVDDDTSAHELAAQLLGYAQVFSVELAREMELSDDDGPSSLPIPASSFLHDLSRSDVLSTPFLRDHRLDSAWAGYIGQAPLARVGLHIAHDMTDELDPVTIAFIDTGVDPDHPLLASALVEGYDFLLDRPGMASEWDSLEPSAGPVRETLDAVLDPSLAVILEGHGQSIPINPKSRLILQQSLAVILEDLTLPEAFGHGTMVAGLLRLVAPHARLMPLKAFDSEGEAHLFHVVSAIYYAVDHGADVINMSFSTDEPSPEIELAIEYAFNHGVVCVAAAGNRGEHVAVYPAAYGRVLGVASTDHSDLLSPFSNFGVEVAAIAAPGEGLISTFPGGHYAAGWGTSFSAPLVAGAAALLSSEVGSREDALMSSALDLDWADGYLSSGRLDILGAVQSGD